VGETVWIKTDCRRGRLPIKEQPEAYQCPGVAHLDPTDPNYTNDNPMSDACFHNPKFQKLGPHNPDPQIPYDADAMRKTHLKPNMKHADRAHMARLSLSSRHTQKSHPKGGNSGNPRGNHKPGHPKNNDKKGPNKTFGKSKGHPHIPLVIRSGVAQMLP
jgi:hypothetical protein